MIQHYVNKMLYFSKWLTSKYNKHFILAILPFSPKRTFGLQLKYTCTNIDMHYMEYCGKSIKMPFSFCLYL